MSTETAQRVRELLTLGAGGGWLGLTTEDCHATYAALIAAGVDGAEEPQPKPYGIDCAIRDPFGNRIRISQIGAPQ